MMQLEAGALEASRDYQRVEHAIRYLDENASRQRGSKRSRARSG